jgi:hypothetical protein
VFIFSQTSARSKNRKRSSRFRSKLKAKNRRRVNRMAGKKLGRRVYKKG